MVRRRHPPDRVMPARRQPERTCVGCRAKDRKATLLRVVRRPDGTVEADPTGRVAGRGAYVHPVAGCLERAARTGALDRALKATLGRAEAARLMHDLMMARGEKA